MVDGNINAIRVPIVAPVNASTNSTTITQKNSIVTLNQLKLPNGETTTTVQTFSEKVLWIGERVQ